MRDGEFTYDSYLEWIMTKHLRLLAERDGFIHAKCADQPGAYMLSDMQESYETGFHLGRMYLSKQLDDEVTR